MLERIFIFYSWYRSGLVWAGTTCHAERDKDKTAMATGWHGFGGNIHGATKAGTPRRSRWWSKVPDGVRKVKDGSAARFVPCREGRA